METTIPICAVVIIILHYFCEKNYFSCTKKPTLLRKLKFSMIVGFLQEYGPPRYYQIIASHLTEDSAILTIHLLMTLYKLNIFSFKFIKYTIIKFFSCILWNIPGSCIKVPRKSLFFKYISMTSINLISCIRKIIFR